MRLVLAMAFVLASVLTVQAQQGGAKKNRPAQTLATAASFAAEQPRAPRSQIGTYTSLGNIDPWDQRTCY